MKKYLIILLALVSVNLVASANVNPSSIPGVLVEETVLTITGKGGKAISTKANPLKVSVVTSDGSVTSLTPILSGNNVKASILLPTIPDSAGELVKITIRTSGAGITESSPQEFVRILTTKPVGFTGDPIDGNIAATQVSLPATAESGVIQQGPQGPKGENGEAGAIGATGPRGPEGPIPDNYPGTNIAGPVNTALTVVNATQSTITTLPNLSSVGTGVAQTVFSSVVNGTAGFIGNLVGNVTGNLTGNVTGNLIGSSTTFTGSLSGDVTGGQSGTFIDDSVVTGKELNGGYSASAGVLANGDTIQEAIAKLDGNVLANDSELSGISSTLGAATSSNTASTLVLRDGSGNFTSNVITANSFSGPLTGNVIGDLTGNVTGNISGSAATFTGSLSGDVTGGQSSTFIDDSVITGKRLNGAYVSSTGTLANGDTLKVAISKLDGNQKNLTTVLGTPTDAAMSGAIVKRDGSGNFAAATITATTFSGNLSGLINAGSSAQPNIQSLSGLQNVGTAGTPITIHGPVTANQLITGTITNAQTAANFSGSLAGDVTGTQAATTIADSVVTGKELNGGYSASAGVLANGDTIQEAIAKLDGNTINNASSINSVNGNVAINTAAIAANSASIASVNGNVAINTSDIATNAADIDALTTAGGDFNGNALTATTAESLKDGSTILSISGGDDVELITAGSVSLTLPNSNGTLALTDGLTPIAVAGSALEFIADGTDVDSAVEYSIDVTGVNVIVLSASLAGLDLVQLDGGISGQRLTIIASGANAWDIVSSGSAVAAGANIEVGTLGTAVLAANETVELIYVGSTWYVTSST